LRTDLKDNTKTKGKVSDLELKAEKRTTIGKVGDGSCTLATWS
jgi:hypothetical protein